MTTLTLMLGVSLGWGHTAAWAADGDLDPTFGGDGRVTTGLGSTDNVAYAVAIQPDGKIVAAGNIDGGSYQGEFFVARYNTNGSLDESFGFLGLHNIDFGSDTDIAKAVAIQPNGKIVVAGYTRVGAIYFDFAIARLNSDGSNDTTFSGDGKTTTDFAGREDFAASVAIQSDGKIVAAGHAYTSSSSADFALARYNTNGSLDTTFDGDGKVTTDFGFTAIATGVAIQGNGKIVAAGYRYYSQSGTNFVVARYNTNGSPDTTFDGDGKVNFYFAEGDAQVKAVAIQSDGKIVAAGYALVMSSADFALARLNTNGSLDTTFSGDGLVITDFAGFGDVARGVAIQSDGKIVAAGSVSPGGPTFGDFGLARFNANGSLDTTFSGDGLVTTDFAYSSDVANGVAIQPNGKIVAAGSVYVSGNYDFALARYQSGGSPTPTPTRTSTSTATRTNTPVSLTSTPTHTSTPAPTNTPLPPTQTPGGPSATPIPTNTPIPTATAIPSSTSTQQPTACPIQFTDVQPDNTFYANIRCLACRGIVSGYPCGGQGEPCDPYNNPYFRPSNPVTRGQLAKIVANSAGLIAPVSGQTFEDVLPGTAFYTYTERLVGIGAMGGYPCGQAPNEPCIAPENRPYFRPGNTASRGQLTKIVSIAAGFTDPPPDTFTFTDVPVGSTYHIYVERLLMNRPGVMNGYPCGGVNPQTGQAEPCDAQNRPYFRPGNTLSRGQTSKIVGNTFFPNCSVVGQPQ